MDDVILATAPEGVEEGSLRMNRNLSMDSLRTGVLFERPCGDLLAPYQRKCEGNMEVLVTDE